MEYSQSGPALLAEAVQRAVGEDFQAFAQRELFGPLGIEPAPGAGSATRPGHTQGFFGVQMIPDDYARLGELMRRGGVWRGRRLLSQRYVREVGHADRTERLLRLAHLAQRRKPCVGPRISERPVNDRRRFRGARGRLLHSPACSASS